MQAERRLGPGFLNAVCEVFFDDTLDNILQPLFGVIMAPEDNDVAGREVLTNKNRGFANSPSPYWT